MLLKIDMSLMPLQTLFTVTVDTDENKCSNNFKTYLINIF